MLSGTNGDPDYRPELVPAHGRSGARKSREGIRARSTSYGNAGSIPGRWMERYDDSKNAFAFLGLVSEARLPGWKSLAPEETVAWRFLLTFNVGLSAAVHRHANVFQAHFAAACCRFQSAKLAPRAFPRRSKLG